MIGYKECQGPHFSSSPALYTSPKKAALLCNSFRPKAETVGKLAVQGHVAKNRVNFGSE